MRRSIKSSRIIIINAILMLCLIVLLIAQNMYFLNKNNATLSNIDEKYNRKTDVVMQMSKVVRERSLYMVTMFLSDDAWIRDDMFIAFHKLKLDFLKLKNELRLIGLLNNEKNIFNEIMLILNNTESLQVDIVERIQSGGSENIQQDISEKDLPLEKKALSFFDDLIEVIKNNTNFARVAAKKEYSNIINYIAVFSIVIFLIVIYLTKRSLSKIISIESSLIQKAESLSWDATHDALTNVYNRRWLEHKFDLLNNDLDSDNRKKLHSLLYIDLDEFKPVNDNYGHGVGDQFLCGITREFEKCIRQNDTLSRMGGDEFAILLENCDANKAKGIAECLLLRVNKFSLNVEDAKISIAGCSIGLKSFSNNNNADFSQIVKQADTACYKAKNNGKNKTHVFSV